MIEKTVNQNTLLGFFCLNALSDAGYKNLDSDSIDSEVVISREDLKFCIKFNNFEYTLSFGDKYYEPIVVECLGKN